LGLTKPRKSHEEDDLFNFETALVVAWPGPGDPPPRTVRLPGLRIECWPQRDGSVLYEVKYRNVPYKPKKTKRVYHDTLQIEGDGAKSLRDEALRKIEKSRKQSPVDRLFESPDELSTTGSRAKQMATMEDSGEQPSLSFGAVPDATLDDSDGKGARDSDMRAFEGSDTVQHNHDPVAIEDSDTYPVDGVFDDSEDLQLRRPGSQGK